MCFEALYLVHSLQKLEDDQVFLLPHTHAPIVCSFLSVDKSTLEKIENFMGSIKSLMVAVSDSYPARYSSMETNVKY